MQRDPASPAGKTSNDGDAATARVLARCIRSATCPKDGRTTAGARRQAQGALLALGVPEPLRGRMVAAALSVPTA